MSGNRCRSVVRHRGKTPRPDSSATLRKHGVLRWSGRGLEVPKLYVVFRESALRVMIRQWPDGVLERVGSRGFRRGFPSIPTGSSPLLFALTFQFYWTDPTGPCSVEETITRGSTPNCGSSRTTTSKSASCPCPPPLEAWGNRLGGEKAPQGHWARVLGP